MLSREGNDSPVRTLALLQVVAARMEVLDGPFDAAGDHHGPRLAANLLLGQHLLMEVVDHDFRLGVDGVFMGLHIATELPLGLLGIKLWVVLHRLGQPVIARYWRIIL